MPTWSRSQIFLPAEHISPQQLTPGAVVTRRYSTIKSFIWFQRVNSCYEVSHCEYTWNSATSTLEPGNISIIATSNVNSLIKATSRGDDSIGILYGDKSHDYSPSMELKHISYSEESGWSTPITVNSAAHLDSSISSVSCISCAAMNIDILFVDTTRTVNRVQINWLDGGPMIGLAKPIPNSTINVSKQLRLVAVTDSLSGGLEVFWLNGDEDRTVIQGACFSDEHPRWIHGLYLGAGKPEEPHALSQLAGVSCGEPHGYESKALFYSDKQGQMRVLRSIRPGIWSIETLSEKDQVATSSPMVVLVQPTFKNVFDGQVPYVLEVFWITPTGEVEHLWCENVGMFDGGVAREVRNIKVSRGGWLIGCATRESEASSSRDVFFSIGVEDGSVRAMHSEFGPDF